MKIRKQSVLWGMLIIACLPGMVLGAGFQIPEQGARSMAMGMGGIGLAEDVSAMYHNPAGLTQIQGTEINLSVAGIAPTATYTRTGYKAQDNDSDFIPVPMLGIASNFGGKLENFVFAFGVNAPFGLRNSYDDAGPQRYLTTDISLATIYIGPYVGWRIAPQFSIGGGVQYVHATAEIGQKINYGGLLYAQAMQQNPGAADPSWNENPMFDGTLDISDATADTFAGNLGLMWTPMEQFQLGVTWRSGVDLDVEGDTKVTIPTALTQATGGAMQSLSTIGKTTVSLPQVFGIGASFKPRAQLTLTADVNWIDWSVYKNIDFDFKQNTPYFPDTKNPRNWEDAWAFRLGAEYMVTDKAAVRAGYLYDQTPIPDESLGPELPTGTRNGVTVGFGYDWGKFNIDAAYVHLFIENREVNDSIRSPKPLGDYESAANIVGVNLGYTF